MMDETHWQRVVSEELALARRARREGNEGKARVCARRAAGFAVEVFFQKQGMDPPAKSAYRLLELLSASSSLPEPVENSLHLLTLRVDEDHQLPERADLIQEAGVLIRALFPEGEFGPEIEG